MLEASIAKLNAAVSEIVGTEGMAWPEKRNAILKNVSIGPFEEFLSWFPTLTETLGPDSDSPNQESAPTEPLDPEG